MLVVVNLNQQIKSNYIIIKIQIVQILHQQLKKIKQIQQIILVKNTPPKVKSTKSVIQYESRSKNSVDLGPKNIRKQGSILGHKKNPSDLQKTQKSTFEHRVKKFMDKSDIDKQLQEKVKQRLKQIRKQIVNHREWVQKTEEQQLWKKQ